MGRVIVGRVIVGRVNGNPFLHIPVNLTQGVEVKQTPDF